MTEIKMAAPEDLDDAVRLFTGYLDFYKRQHPADQIRSFIQERLANKDSIIYLAYADNRAVGIAQIYPTLLFPVPGSLMGAQRPLRRS